MASATNNDNYIKITELLPNGVRLRKIQTGSELLLAYELNKYCKIFLDKYLSLGNVTIAKELYTETIFSFVVTNGLDVGFIPERENLKSYTDEVRKFFTETVDGVVFKSVTDDEVVYDFNHDVEANRVIRDGDNRSATYISLLAYIIVKAYAERKDIPKLVIDHENYIHEQSEYSDLLILLNYGNRLVKDILEVKFSNHGGYQPEWEAYVQYHRQLGYMNRPYTMKEKYRYLNRNFEVGDVVLLYTRKKTTKGDKITRLTKCYPAVITAIENNFVRYTYYPIIQTRLTRIVTLDEVERELEGEERKSFYTSEDYDTFTVCSETVNLSEIGVDKLTWDETLFFIKPLDFDGSVQCFRTKEGIDRVWISTLDTIYAVFEDRGVEYNKDKFLNIYFKNRIPVYEQYKSVLEEN